MSRVHDALLKAHRGEIEPPQPDAALPASFPAEGGPAEFQPRAPSGEEEERSPAPPVGTVSTTLDVPGQTVDVLPALHGGVNGKIVLERKTEGAPIEQYRRLGARLHLAQAERGCSTVMVTSALLGEGKTLTASNLALTMSQSYKRRVLLVDADLRRPGVHEVFGIPNVTGLNDVHNDSECKVPLIRVTERLAVLTAGRPDPDPMTVLSSRRMQRVLQEASAAFDWVIIDTPPVALLSDAHVLTSLVDTVLLVVRAGCTPLAAIRTAITAVGRDRIAGVVLNCADTAIDASKYGYHHYGARPTSAGGAA